MSPEVGVEQAAMENRIELVSRSADSPRQATRCPMGVLLASLTRLAHRLSACNAVVMLLLRLIESSTDRGLSAPHDLVSNTAA